MPSHSSAGSFCLQIPSQQTEVAGDSHEFLMEFVQVFLCSVPITPYWDLASLCVLQVQGQHGLNCMPCPLNPVLLSTATKSLNFHESHTLPESLEMQLLMCVCLVSVWREHFLLFLTYMLIVHRFLKYCFIMKW
jgi:hypothetical protein